eukprot:31362-Hanusia_phi.AAC.2
MDAVTKQELSPTDFSRYDALYGIKTKVVHRSGKVYVKSAVRSRVKRQDQYSQGALSARCPFEANHCPTTLKVPGGLYCKRPIAWKGYAASWCYQEELLVGSAGDSSKIGT